MKDRIFIWQGTRNRVSSLKDALFSSHEVEGSVMVPELMRQEDASTCRWVRFHIVKGVTNPTSHITVCGIPEEMFSGMHALLVEGLPDVDPAPLCYDNNHIKGFGDFTRWVFFKNSSGENHFFGVDFSLELKPTSGVATSFQKISAVVETAVRHGLPQETEVALLNWRMCEPEYLTKVRCDAGLITASDWITKGRKLFSQKSAWCPRCGQKTLDRNPSEYCYLCGCRPSNFYT